MKIKDEREFRRSSNLDREAIQRERLDFRRADAMTLYLRYKVEEVGTYGDLFLEQLHQAEEQGMEGFLVQPCLIAAVLLIEKMRGRE